ncbi:MAG: hypothetical protein KGH64_05205, partial [Candidatus Micrarchaeota archaeon]|nr:hypothetical protein [Candidatus Micrarchaeota archaeon]
GKKSDNEDERTAAGRGMPKLLGLYEDLFEKRGLGIAQLLISSEQLSDHDDMRRLAQRINDWWNTRTVPIINENDPIARSSATRGDNDSLSAEVAIHVSAQTIVFMSIERETSMGRGGADAKAAAMSKAESKGIRTMVVDGKAPHVIKGLFDGGNVLRKALRDGEAIRSGNGRKISSV